MIHIKRQQEEFDANAITLSNQYDNLKNIVAELENENSVLTGINNTHSKLKQHAAITCALFKLPSVLVKPFGTW